MSTCEGCVFLSCFGTWCAHAIYHGQVPQDDPPLCKGRGYVPRSDELDNKAAPDER